MKEEKFQHPEVPKGYKPGKGEKDENIEPEKLEELQENIERVRQILNVDQAIKHLKDFADLHHETLIASEALKIQDAIRILKGAKSRLESEEVLQEETTAKEAVPEKSGRSKEKIEQELEENINFEDLLLQKTSEQNFPFSKPESEFMLEIIRDKREMLLEELKNQD